MRTTLFLLLAAPALALATSTSPLPTGFVENRGQVIDQHGHPNSAVRYLLHRPGLNLQLRDDGFSYDVYDVDREALPPADPDAPFDLTALRGRATFLLHRIDVSWNDGSMASIEAVEPASEHLGFVGPLGAVEGVRHFARVTYHDITPGIDLVFKLDEGGMPKYDVVIRPSGDLAALRLRYQGADDIALKDGTLQLGTRHGPFVERIPVSHLLGGPAVDCHFELHADGSVGFSVPPIPSGATLVIDPWLAWGTYMGGVEWDACLALTAGGEQLYMAGETRSPLALATTGAHQNDLTGTMDAFVARFNTEGDRLWCTYLGGSGEESAHGIAVDAGHIYIGGHGTSTDLPGSEGTHQTTPAGNGDAFLAAFTLDGQLEWLTWFGGPQADAIQGVAAAQGRVHVVGWTESSTGIATPGAPQGAYAGEVDAFLASFRSDGTLLRATYQGGSSVDRGNGIAVEGALIVTTGSTGSTSGMTTPGGHQGFFGGTLDAYLACHDTTGALLWSTYYGGGLAERGYAVTLRGGAIHLGGATESGQYISTPGAHQSMHGGGGWDGFIARFTINGERLWGTYYGGYDTDLVYALAAERDGVYATGFTSSVYVMGGMMAHQPFFMGGFCDAFVARFGTGGERRWGTYYGGHLGDQGLGIVARENAVYVGGFTGSTTLVSTPGAHQTIIGGNVDVMLARFSAGIVGLAEHDPMDGAVTLRPNPAIGPVMLRWQREGPAPSQWRLLDASGALLREGRAPEHGPWALQMDVSDLAHGTYIVHVSGNGIDHSARLVVAR